MLETGMGHNEVARRFGEHRNTIQNLWRRYQQQGNTRDRPRSGRPRVTSQAQDNHIRVTHLLNRFRSATLTARTIPGLRVISARTVRNRLLEHNIRPRRPAIRPILLQRHRNARLAWSRQHLRFTHRDWSGVLFTIWTVVTVEIESTDVLMNATLTLTLCSVQVSAVGASWCGEASHHTGGRSWWLWLEIWLPYATGMRS